MVQDLNSALPASEDTITGGAISKLEVRVIYELYVFFGVEFIPACCNLCSVTFL